MALRNVLIEIHAALEERGIDHALIGGLANDPRRRNQDLADVQRVLRNGNPDMARVREYFQLFDREKDLEALLAEDATR